MKWSALKDEPCSVARTVALIGDRWTLMIVRDCFLGVRRFDDLHARLGISRTIINDRLKRLTGAGLLYRSAYQTRPTRYDYRLTPKGLDLHALMLTIVNFGDRHLAGAAGPPLLHRHRTCGCIFSPVLVCSACGEAVQAREVEALPGPGAVVGD